MYPTLSTVRTQQKLIQAQRSNNDCYRIFNLLTRADLLDKVEEQLPEHRERLFPPTETLAMFITQALSADRSCQNIVNQAAMQRLISGLSSCSTHTGGYCRARSRLPLSMIKNISQQENWGQNTDSTNILNKIVTGSPFFEINWGESTVFANTRNYCVPPPLFHNNMQRISTLVNSC